MDAKISNHTPGTWSGGSPTISGGAVVSDQIPADYPKNTGHDDVTYYGGFLIAESVHKRDIALISAAPDLLEALINVFEHAKEMINERHPHYKAAEAAIKKATSLSL